tara:strand:- start:4069 stop:4692 length:624 start_codon:yes stop_codon:yes gene_type:complete
MSFGLVKHNNNSISAITTAGQLTSGSMTLIKEQTASSSSSISFVDGSGGVVLDSTYPIYVVKLLGLHPASDADLQFQCSIDSGSNYNVTMQTSYPYASHNESDSASSLAYFTGGDQANGTSFQRIAKIGNDNDQAASGEMFFFNLSSTTFVKHFISRVAESHPSEYIQDNLVTGYFNTTNNIDAIQFKMSSGNIDAGTIKLYGIKGS